MIHHPHVQFVQRLVNAGRIEDGDLAARIVEDSDDAIARRLRLLGDDGHFLTEDAIEQCRFAGIRAADERDDAEARFR